MHINQETNQISHKKKMTKYKTRYYKIATVKTLQWKQNLLFS